MERSLQRLRTRIELDEELRAIAPSRQILAEMAAKCRSSIQFLAAACECYADRICLGERPVDESPPRTLTYARLWERLAACASGLRALGLGDPGARIGICGFGCLDYTVADFACLYLTAVSVPLQTMPTVTELQPILAETEMQCLVCGLEQLETVSAAVPGSPSLKQIVLMGVDSRKPASVAEVGRWRRLLAERHGGAINVLTMQELEGMGREGAPVPFVDPAVGGRDPLLLLLYTSGSTGAPKGAMIPESGWIEQYRFAVNEGLPYIPTISLNYMPLNHIAARNMLLLSIMRGGCSWFPATNDLTTLFDDIRAVRPTMMILLPRVSGMIYHELQTQLLRALAAGGDPEAVREGVVRKVGASFLGDRLTYAITSTAPLAREVLAFLKEAFAIPVLNTYGMTETGPVTIDGKILPDKVIAFKLVDVPELGYLASDQPYPRGELRVKVRQALQGYYKQPDATAALRDEEGFLRTGDIVEQRGPSEVVWLDRKNSVYKLAQGEFVSVLRLETIFAKGSPFIRQVFIYASGVRSYVLAVLVPDLSIALTHPGVRDVADQDAALKRLLREELRRIAGEEQLKGWEVPRDFIVEPDPFSVSNGLLTDMNKPARPRLRARYGERLEALYDEIERKQREALVGLDGQEGLRAAESVRRAIAATLGLGALEDIQEQTRFMELGGDSLSAVRLRAVLRELTGVTLPIDMLVKPSVVIGDLVRYVEQHSGKSSTDRRVSFEEVHGADATVVRSADVRLERFLSPADLEQAARAAPPRDDVQTVFLTGATGFLGRFVVLDLLEQLPHDRGKVICLVRAGTKEAARQTLERTFGAGDPALRERFERLDGPRRVEAVTGDLSQPGLGLEPGELARLSAEVDAVIHSGALVNHFFSYPDLFTNVLGSVEVLRLALTGRLKPLTFISTVGVADGLVGRRPIGEDEHAQVLREEIRFDRGYAAGYFTGKWVVELLLHQAHERLGLPVNVFRCPTLMAHSEYRGQTNATDWISRMWHGIVVTGIAPRSFYQRGAVSGFDGVPVDVAAESVARVATHPKRAHSIYHVTESSQAVSLDTLVDWIRSAGYAVQRLDDHASWFERFRAALEALPAKERARSLIPLLGPWEQPLPDGLPVFDNQRLQGELRALGGRGIAPLTERYVHKALDDLVQVGLIKPPA